MAERKQRRPQKKSKRFKRQPRLRRVDALATPMPATVVPKAVARRRRRNRQPFKFPTATVMVVLTSPRWISLTILILSLYAMNLIGSRTDYYFTTIPVEGVLSITPDEVVATSGLAGQHVFSIDPEIAAAQIADTPGILSASVTVSWPNNVAIQIVEDTPVAIWEQEGTPYWINQEGILLPARINIPGLLRIQTDYPDAILGRVIADETAEEAAPFTALGTIPEELLHSAFLLKKLAPNGQTLSNLAYYPGDGLSYRDERGWMVHLGLGDDMAQKLAVYEAIVTELAVQGLTPSYVDVSNQDKPFYRVSTEEATQG